MSTDIPVADALAMTLDECMARGVTVHLMDFGREESAGLCGTIGRTTTRHELKRGRITCPECLGLYTRQNQRGDRNEADAQNPEAAHPGLPARHVPRTTLDQKLQFVAFQKLPRNVPNLGKRGDLVTVATNTRVLIAAKGGEYSGDWPKGQTVVVHRSQLPRLKGKLNEDVLITAKVSRKGGILQEVHVSDTPTQFDPGKVPVHEYPAKLYPDWIDAIGHHTEDYPIARKPIPVNAAYFADLTNAFKLFTDPKYGHRVNLSLHLGGFEEGVPIAWGTGFTLADERAMIVVLMGLRP